MKQADIQKAFDELSAKYLQALRDLDNALDQLDNFQPVGIDPEQELRSAASVMARSEFNKEDMSEEEIYEKLSQNSGPRNKIGFWAMPLPKDSSSPTMKYTGKRR